MEKGIKETLLSVGYVTEPNFTSQVTLKDFVDFVKKGGYKEEVGEVRKYPNKEEQSELKKKLLATTVSGLFDNRQPRGESQLLEYTHLIQVDLDLDKPYPQVYRDKLAKLPFMVFSYISPSGRGVKGFALVNTDEKHHAMAFDQVNAYVAKMLDLKKNVTDSKVRNIKAYCYISDDPKAKVNWNASPFYVITNKESRTVNPINKSKVAESRIKGNENMKEAEKPVKLLFLTALLRYLKKTGNRLTTDNEKWYKMSYILYGELRDEGKDFFMDICRLDGVEHDEQESLKQWERATQKWDESKDLTWGTLVHYAKEVGYTNESVVTNEKEQHKYFPLDVYEKLPDLFKKCVSPFGDNRREKDLMLLSSLVVLSACFPNVSGYYKRFRLYPNFYVFISAPASAGKSTLRWASCLGKPLQNKFKKEFEEALRNLKEGGKRPVKKRLFAPTNSSSAAFDEALSQNKDGLLLFETEADVLTNTMGQEWAKILSTSLRKGFHHETISILRKGKNGEFIEFEIEFPKISILFSGTPYQIKSLFKDTENGLFSRFTFYTFSHNAKWDENIFDDDEGEDLETYFLELGEEVTKIREYLEDQSMDIRMKLTQKQKNTFNELFSEKHDDFGEVFGEKGIPTIRRLGVVCFRIMMVLTAVRIYQNGVTTDNVNCSDLDFEIALSLTQTLMSHGGDVLNIMPDNSSESTVSFVSLKQKEFFNALPLRFTPKEYFEIAKKHGITKGTWEHWQRMFKDKNLIVKEDKNTYKKII